MPKTESERKTLKEFISEYGEEAGKKYYYSLRNKSPKFDRSQGGGFSSKKAQVEWWVNRLDKFPSLLKSELLKRLKLVKLNDPQFQWWLSRLQAIKAEHEGHLITDSKGNKHLPTHSNGKPNHRLMGAAWAALHGGYRGNKYEGPNKSQAISKLKKLYSQEGLEVPSSKSQSGASYPLAPNAGLKGEDKKKDPK